MRYRLPHLRRQTTLLYFTLPLWLVAGPAHGWSRRMPRTHYRVRDHRAARLNLVYTSLHVPWYLYSSLSLSESTLLRLIQLQDETI